MYSRDPERQEEEWAGDKKLIGEIIAENFPNLMINIDLYKKLNELQV